MPSIRSGSGYRGVVDVHPVDLGPRASDFELELCNNMMEL